MIGLGWAVSSSIGQDASGEPPATDALPILEASETGELKAREGEKVIVHGETGESGKSPSGTNFVNFKGSEFYLTAFKSDLEPFKDGEPADLFDGKRIVVTGVISIYRDKPQIKLTRPEQVRVLEPGEIFPPEKPQEIAAVTPEEENPEIVVSAEQPAEPETPRENPPVDWRKFFK